MSHLATPWHCWLDRLGMTTVVLIAVLGGLYISAYTTGWPHVPDPAHRTNLNTGCHRIGPTT